MEFIKRDKYWISKAYICYKIQQKRKQIEKLEAKYFDELKELSENKSSRGGGFLFKLILRKGNVDYSQIPQLIGIDLDKYRKPSIDSWKLELELENLS